MQTAFEQCGHTAAAAAAPTASPDGSEPQAD